jgi:c(7)-type cytochrome triheme protein
MKIEKRLLVIIGFTVLALVACDRYLTDSRSANYVVSSGAGMGKRWEDNRQYAVAAKTEKLENDGIHDPANDAIHVLQEPSDAMAAFPYDRRGGVNWVKALDLGIINPRADLKGKSEMLVMDMDVMFKDTGNMPWVKFPHIAHTKWLACENCHPAIFLPQIGADNPSMDGILAGEYCGKCHDKVAFALWICERCHNTPNPNSPAKWWQGPNDNAPPPVAGSSAADNN